MIQALLVKVKRVIMMNDSQRTQDLWTGMMPGHHFLKVSSQIGIMKAVYDLD